MRECLPVVLSAATSRPLVLPYRYTHPTASWFTRPGLEPRTLHSRLILCALRLNDRIRICRQDGNRSISYTDLHDPPARSNAVPWPQWATVALKLDISCFAENGRLASAVQSKSYETIETTQVAFVRAGRAQTY